MLWIQGDLVRSPYWTAPPRCSTTGSSPPPLRLRHKVKIKEVQGKTHTYIENFQDNLEGNWFQEIYDISECIFPREKLNQVEFIFPHDHNLRFSAAKSQEWEHGRDMPSHVWDSGSTPLSNCTTSCLWTLRKKCGCTWPTERKWKLCLWTTAQPARMFKVQVAAIFSVFLWKGNLVFLWHCDLKLPLEFHSQKSLATISSVVTTSLIFTWLNQSTKTTIIFPLLITSQPKLGK